MSEADSVRLGHMLDMACIVQAITLGKTKSALDSDVVLRLALTRALEVIGEAASRVTGEFQQATPQLPWSEIVGMRNRLIHAYFDVNLDILWHTVTDSIPILITELEKLLPPDTTAQPNP